jgi:hypothetical protein
VARTIQCFIEPGRNSCPGVVAPLVFHRIDIIGIERDSSKGPRFQSSDIPG